MIRFFRFIKSLFVRPKQEMTEPVPELPMGQDPAPAPAAPKEEEVISPGSLGWYRYFWDKCTLTQDKVDLGRLDWAVTRIIKNVERYRVVERLTGTPWQLIAAIHYREASFDFNSCLHNGDPLGAKTVHVPKGRGPFYTWEEAAVDALKYDGLAKAGAWSIPEMLQKAEKYNGLGYIKFHPNVMSPYVWSGTHIYANNGKYSYDGKFEPGVKDDQIGVAAIFKALQAKGLI